MGLGFVSFTKFTLYFNNMWEVNKWLTHITCNIWLFDIFENSVSIYQFSLPILPSFQMINLFNIYIATDCIIVCA
jgi:hypothetical protein